MRIALVLPVPSEIVAKKMDNFPDYEIFEVDPDGNYNVELIQVKGITDAKDISGALQGLVMPQIEIVILDLGSDWNFDEDFDQTPMNLYLKVQDTPELKNFRILLSERLSKIPGAQILDYAAPYLMLHNHVDIKWDDLIADTANLERDDEYDDMDVPVRYTATNIELRRFKD